MKIAYGHTSTASGTGSTASKTPSSGITGAAKTASSAKGSTIFGIPSWIVIVGSVLALAGAAAAFPPVRTPVIMLGVAALIYQLYSLIGG